MDANLSYIKDLFSNLEMHCPILGRLCENTYTYRGFLKREDHVCSLDDSHESERDPQSLLLPEEQGKVKVEAQLEKENFEERVNEEEVKGATPEDNQ